MDRLKDLTLDEKIGQLICARFDWENLEALVAEGRVGTVHGVLNELESAKAAAEHINHFQKISKYPLLISGEQEQGSYLNFTGGTRLPDYMAFGATRSKELAYEFGRINAIEGRAVGYSIISCPTLDVNIYPENPIINTRALSEDPELVTQLGLESCRAIVEHKGLTCVCHCPGHGASIADSHLKVSTIYRTDEELWEVDLMPYRAGIPAGYMNLIMTAHLSYPAWEEEADLPATLSRKIITGIIRERLGYNGIIATDSLYMKAISDNYSPGETAVRAVVAGCDILLSMEADETSKAIKNAVESGVIPMADLDASVTRILEAKEWLGLFEKATVDVSALDSIIGCPEHLAIAKRAAREAVTLLSGQGLPIPTSSDTVVITASDDDTLENEVRKRNTNAQVFSIVDGDSTANALQAARKAKHVIIGIQTSVRAYDESSVRGNEQLMSLIRDVAASGVHTSLLVLGNPYIAKELPDAAVMLCTFSSCPDSISAAVEAIYGEFKPTGRLPITISEKYPFGFG